MKTSFNIGLVNVESLTVNRAFPLDLVCPERLSLQSPTGLPYVVTT